MRIQDISERLRIGRAQRGHNEKQRLPGQLLQKLDEGSQRRGIPVMIRGRSQQAIGTQSIESINEDEMSVLPGMSGGSVFDVGLQIFAGFRGIFFQQEGELVDSGLNRCDGHRSLTADLVRCRGGGLYQGLNETQHEIQNLLSTVGNDLGRSESRSQLFREQRDQSRFNEGCFSTATVSGNPNKRALG